MELGKGRGGLLEEEDPFYIVGEKDPTVIPSLSPRGAVLPHRAAVLLQRVVVLPLQGAVLQLVR